MPDICKATGKRRHNKDGAEIAHKRHTNRSIINVYKCEHCNAYHLGRSRSSRRFQQFIDDVIKADQKRARSK